MPSMKYFMVANLIIPTFNVLPSIRNLCRMLLLLVVIYIPDGKKL